MRDHRVDSQGNRTAEPDEWAVVMPCEGQKLSGAKLDRICQTLAEIAPLSLAEPWDNVGLLVGDRRQVVRRVMTCLSVTGDVVDEAVERGVDLIVVHHPIPFKPLAKITSDTTTGTLLLRLIRSGISVYSAHTAYDSATDGINQQLANLVGLVDVEPLVIREAAASSTTLGSGRHGRLSEPVSVAILAERVASGVGAIHWNLVGEVKGVVDRVGIACGSGGSFLPAARRRGCQVLVTGEATFHTCLEAEALGIAMVLIGHFASERFAMQRLAEQLSLAMKTGATEVEVFSAAVERSPLRVATVSSEKH